MTSNKHTKETRHLAFIIILLAAAAINSQGNDTLSLPQGIGPEKAPVFFLDFYQRHLSHLRGTHCPLYPSCSEYARMVIERYPPLQAFPLTCDRLLRCGHDFGTYTDTVIDLRKRWIDMPYSLMAPFEDSGCAGVETYAAAAGQDQADFFYRNGFFEQAYHEYLRRLSVERDAATVRKAACAALYLLAAKRYYAEGLYPAAYATLEKYQSLFTTPVLHEEYRVLAAVTALYCGVDTLPKLTENDFSPNAPLRIYQGRIDSLHRALDRLRPRNSVAAGCLSVVVPGAGYLLGERMRTALFAFLFNGLFTWSTVEFVQHENYGTAAFTALVGSGFYFGSIAGSVRAVKSYNKQKRHSLIRRYTDDLDVAP
jgi:putative component of membrane protein insertase Oxa1/YidC/SpoIIIJ protein YidD